MARVEGGDAHALDSKQKRHNYRVEDDIYIINTTDLRTELLAVRYTTDKKILVIGCADGTLMTVKPNSHEVISSFQAAKEAQSTAVTCIREHPGSEPGKMTMLASFSSGHVRCWDVSKPELVFSLRESRQVLGLAASSDKSHFITAGDDGVLYVYDLNTYKPISKLESSISTDVSDGHRTRIFTVAFHPLNSREAISGGWDDVIYFWDMRNRHSTRHTGPTHICGSDALDISPDGKMIVSGGYQRNNQFQTWDYGTGRLVETLKTDINTTSLYAVTYLSDNMVCSGGTDPSLFRTVNIAHQSTTGIVKPAGGGVFSMHRGPVGLKYSPRKKLNSGRDKPETTLRLPRVAFCAGRNLFEVDLY